LRLLKKTEQFHGCGQQEVAKIVHCGEHYWFNTMEEEATAKVASSFLKGDDTVSIRMVSDQLEE